MLGYLAAFGALGVLCRHGADTLLLRAALPFPASTFGVNLLGCFLAGLIAASRGSSEWKLILLTGFCGGFTTFSAYALQTLTMENRAMALAYFALSPLAGLACAWLGMRLAA